MIAEGLMPKTLKQILFWTPRILGILFVLFLSLFALDVFGEGYSFWQTVLALLIHLIPTILLIVALVLAWRWEWVGAAAFIGFGVWVLAAVRGFDIGTYLLLAGVPFLNGVLFLVGWIYRKQIRVK
jgi:hypothetical protein